MTGDCRGGEFLKDRGLPDQVARRRGAGVLGASARSDTFWRDGAECRVEDPELFFPEGRSGSALQQTIEAKRVCARCDVRAECLSYALENNIDDGVWGGLSEDERRALKRRNTRHSRNR